MMDGFSEPPEEVYRDPFVMESKLDLEFCDEVILDNPWSEANDVTTLPGHIFEIPFAQIPPIEVDFNNPGDLFNLHPSFLHPMYGVPLARFNRNGEYDDIMPELLLKDVTTRLFEIIRSGDMVELYNLNQEVGRIPELYQGQIAKCDKNCERMSNEIKMHLDSFFEFCRENRQFVLKFHARANLPFCERFVWSQQPDDDHNQQVEAQIWALRSRTDLYRRQADLQNVLFAWTWNQFLEISQLEFKLLRSWGNVRWLRKQKMEVKQSFTPFLRCMRRRANANPQVVDAIRYFVMDVPKE